MGFQFSPYLCTQAFGWSEDFILGEPGDQENNPLAWKDVVLNLPGSGSYSPTNPWVYRRKFDGSLAACFGTYIDDIKTGDNSEGGCQNTTRRVASRVNRTLLESAGHRVRSLVLGLEPCANRSMAKVFLLPVPRRSGIRQGKLFLIDTKKLWSKRAVHCATKN